MSQYKKTAKDIAFDKERAKLKSEISKLREEVLYWKTANDKAQESASQFEELYLESLKYLDMDPKQFQKMREASEGVNKMLSLMNMTGIY